MPKKTYNKRSLSVNTEPFLGLLILIRIPWLLASGSELFESAGNRSAWNVWGSTILHFPLLSCIPFSSLFTRKLVHILFILFQYAKSVSLTNEKVKTQKKKGRFQVGRGDSDDSSEGNNRISVIKVTNPVRSAFNYRLQKKFQIIKRDLCYCIVCDNETLYRVQTLF